MALLEYEIKVTGSDQVAEALASIERSFAEHAKRIDAIMNPDDPPIMIIRKSGAMEILSDAVVRHIAPDGSTWTEAKK